jgi:hypothetical protein
MKNYVVWTNCQVNEKEHQFGIAPCGDPISRAAYDTMFRVSRSSAKKFLAGDWEEIVFTDPAETRVHMFQQNWQRILDLWHREPCNILYLDSDAMFVKPTEIFGRFNEYRLFNWTDPKSNTQFPNYYNAGVRYYPNTMSSSVWKIGKDIANNWNLDIWDQEQLIFNAMFWSQGVLDPHHPELNWQGMHLRLSQTYSDAISYLNNWNTIPITDAHIIHVHGSRNAIDTAKCMKDISQELGIIDIY